MVEWVVIAVLFLGLVVLAYMLHKQERRTNSLEFGHDVLVEHTKTTKTAIDDAFDQLGDHNKKLCNLGQK